MTVEPFVHLYTWQEKIHHLYRCLYIYCIGYTLLYDILQVVPGQAGGGSFKREKDLYSKERICL